MSGTERLISVDSHYRVTVDQLKEAVPSRSRDAIDAANRRVEAPKLAAMQMRGTKPLGLGSYLHEAARHPGYSDPVARLEAMDQDGVDVEILFSDLSAFRIIANMLDGWQETSGAFTDPSAEFAALMERGSSPSSAGFSPRPSACLSRRRRSRFPSGRPEFRGASAGGVRAYLAALVFDQRASPGWPGGPGSSRRRVGAAPAGPARSVPRSRYRRC